TCETEEQVQPPFFDTTDIPFLNDSLPSIVYASACLTSYPEVPSLGRKLLLHGAVAYIGATRPALGPVADPLSWQNGGNTGLNYLFAKYMIGEKMKVGEALYYAKNEYTHYFSSESASETGTNLYDFNLYGDPGLRWRGFSTGIRRAENYVLLRLFATPYIFINSTTLVYSLKREADVDVFICDVCGRKVATLVHERKEPGMYIIEWNGRDAAGKNLPPGIYFGVAACENTTCTVKLIRIK
ncbi:hypothetical protein DRQ20_04340, partial [bacterium]